MATFYHRSTKTSLFFNSAFYYCPPPNHTHQNRILSFFIFLVLGTFPRAFSQVRLPKWQFPKWQLPKWAISQAVQLAAMGAEQWALRLGWVRWPSAAARTGLRANATAKTDLGSWHLRNCTFGKFPLGKIPLGNFRLEKILWESAITSIF